MSQPRYVNRGREAIWSPAGRLYYATHQQALSGAEAPSASSQSDFRASWPMCLSCGACAPVLACMCAFARDMRVHNARVALERIRMGAYARMGTRRAVQAGTPLAL